MNGATRSRVLNAVSGSRAKEGGGGIANLAVIIVLGISLLLAFEMVVPTVAAVGTFVANMSPHTDLGDKAYVKASGGASCSIVVHVGPWAYDFDDGTTQKYSQWVSLAGFDSIQGTVLVDLHAPGWADDATYWLDVYHNDAKVEGWSGSTGGDWTGWVSSSVLPSGAPGAGAWKFVVTVRGRDWGTTTCQKVAEFTVYDTSGCPATLKYQRSGAGSVNTLDSIIHVNVDMWAHQVLSNGQCVQDYHYMTLTTDPYSWVIYAQSSDTYVDWKTQIPSWNTIYGIGLFTNNGCGNVPNWVGGSGYSYLTAHGEGFGSYCGRNGEIYLRAASNGFRTNNWYSDHYGQTYAVVLTLIDISYPYDSLSNTYYMTA